MTYLADQRHALELATLVRERALPEGALGSMEVKPGDRVDLPNVVAHGMIPARYVIIEAAQHFKLKDPDDLDTLLLVDEGEAVEEEQPLATETGRRAKRLLSPVTGVIAYIDNGRIIVQETPEIIDLKAQMNGQVVRVEAGHGIVIETAAGLVQGVWGNGRSVVGVIRPEPEEGLESIYGDQLDATFRGALVITRRTLKETGLLIMEDQGIAGVIAPSMDISLREQAMQHKSAILLTEGFGSMRMSGYVSQLLQGMIGRQATMDAILPKRWDNRRPEVIINRPVRSNERPPRLGRAIELRKGMSVRVTRAPYEGQTGQVVNLPNTPVMIDNGLRVMCAQVKLTTGDTTYVPLANLEVFGR